MPSRALDRWNDDAQAALDEIEDAHRAVGGAGRGRRYATLQVNHAYVTLLSSQFQGFCRDLHTEAVAVVVGSLAPPVLGPLVQNLFVQGRKLDHGNPNPGNLGSDFGRLGMAFWPTVNALDHRNTARQAALETLNTWRNAIAHQDWSDIGTGLQLKQVRAWRATCRECTEVTPRQMLGDPAARRLPPERRAAPRDAGDVTTGASHKAGCCDAPNLRSRRVGELIRLHAPASAPER